MRRVSVVFIDSKIKQEFNSLKSGKFENKKLYEFISRALNDLKENPSCGVKIPKQIWPREYKNIKITNLWKYNEYTTQNNRTYCWNSYLQPIAPIAENRI